MLFDSDVLIWLLRDDARALQVIGAAEARTVSVVTYMELLQGARDRRDMRRITSVLAEFAFQVLPLSESIGHRASVYIEEHALASRIGVVDALVAATAAEHGLVVCTANTKHYRAIKDLEIHTFRP